MEQNGFFGWNNVSVGLLVALVIFLIVLYIFTESELTKWKPIKLFRAKLYKCHSKCGSNKSNCEWVNSMRGDNYGFDPNIQGGKYVKKNIFLLSFCYYTNNFVCNIHVCRAI